MAIKQLKIEFASKWVLEHRNDEKLPVRAFMDYCSDIFFKQIEIVSFTHTECTINIKMKIENGTIKIFINRILKEQMHIDNKDEVVKFTISEIKQEINSIADVNEKGLLDKTDTTASNSDAISKKAEENDSSTDIRINSLIGVEEFKALLEEIKMIAPLVINHDTYEAFAACNYLFAINEGYGFSTYLKLLADLLDEKKLFKFSYDYKVTEVKLLPPNKEDPFNPVTSILYYNNRKGRLLIAIDISEWMLKITDKKFRDFLLLIDDYSIDNIFVFRIPFVEYDVLDNIKASLQDVLFIRSLAFSPMSMEELIECAKCYLAKFNFTTTDDVWQVFQIRITEEKSDGKFYGINTVNKIVREMVYLKQLSDSVNKKDDSVIKKEDIYKLTKTNNNLVNGIEVLSNMIGMEKIKESVEEIIAHIELSISNSNIEFPCIHMRFVGAPGTGKTTVARIIGKILKERGVLRNGNFFEYSGRDFCGRYVGETAPKTSSICRDAYGSVLFIDEAYSLYRGDDSYRDYGKEALDTLIAEMENHRKELVVIMAGYTDEMTELMKGNTGLESRMPYMIEFPNFSRDQLCSIYFQMLNDSFEYESDFKPVVRDFFNSIDEDALMAKNFSNARFVRNLFERTCAKASMRKAFDKSGKLLLTKEDFHMASSDRVFQSLISKKTQNRIGF